MSAGGSDEFDAYLRGYEDAMRAAGGDQLLTSAPAVARPATAKRGIGAAVGRGAGFAFGWLVGFPLWFGVVGGVTGLFVGGPQWALAGFLMAAGVAFAFAVFVGGGVLALRFWPVTLAIGVLMFVLVRLFG